jgi:hypothetical protein
VLTEKSNVEKNPNDGEAWGRLAKAYKEVIMMPKGWLREDPAGGELYRVEQGCIRKMSCSPAKRSALALRLRRPAVGALSIQIYFAGKTDTENILEKTLTALQTTLALDPNNQLAKDLLLEISYQIPQAVQADGNNFVLLGLTATPIPPTPWGGFPTETPPPTPEPATTAQAESAPTAFFVIEARCGKSLVRKRLPAPRVVWDGCWSNKIK